MKNLIIMIALLIPTQSVMANDKIPTRHLDIWGITTSGDLYLKTKQGKEYIAPLEQCPVSSILELEDLNIYMDGRTVRNGKTVHLYNKDTKNRNNLRCKLGEIARIA